VSSFGKSYAGIYDALYATKNYAAEAQFALDQIRIILPNAPSNIIDLGCGTGLHAVQLAQTGVSVTGVDRSDDMILVARNRRGKLSEELQRRLEFRIGDIRTIVAQRRYDAILSLFHVVSYLVEDHDLEAAFEISRRHLNVGGAFLFDFWYGPAVLRHPPQQRTKTIQVGERHIKRRTIPQWDMERCRVSINYDIEIKNIASGETIREWEQHVIRYFFCDEVIDRLGRSGFEIVNFGEWLTGNPPSDTSFSVFALARAK
jgi:SAM-dependent methyltransferase